MKKVILSVAIGMALSFSANAANPDNNSSGSAYDRKQDARIDAFQSSINGKVDQSVFEADQQRQDANIDQTKQAIANESNIRNQKDQELQSQINGKVGQADFEASQQAQNEHINAVQGAAQTANDRATNLEGRADAVEQAVRDTNAQVAVTDARSINNAERLDGVEAKNGQQDATLADHDSRITLTANGLASEVATRSEQVATLTTGVAAARATGDYANSRVDAANANIEANRQALVNTNKRVAQNTADIAGHEQRITSLEQQTSKGFSDLKRQIDDNKRDANAGIAGVAAIASIPQVTDKQSFSVGAGIGARGSEQALAVGFSGRVTENVVTKVAVSTDTQNGWTVGAGVSYGW